MTAIMERLHRNNPSLPCNSPAPSYSKRGWFDSPLKLRGVRGVILGGGVGLIIVEKLWKKNRRNHFSKSL
jgi:hypothetical protein